MIQFLANLVSGKGSSPCLQMTALVCPHMVFPHCMFVEREKNMFFLLLFFSYRDKSHWVRSPTLLTPFTFLEVSSPTMSTLEVRTGTYDFGGNKQSVLNILSQPHKFMFF